MAWHLCALTDPCRKREFGAPTDQIGAVTGYSKTMAELRKNRSNNAPHLGEAVDDENPSQAGGNNKKDKKGAKGDGKNGKTKE